MLAGDDAWTLPVLAMGGDGVVSVASNEIPGEMAALCAAARAGDWDAARRIHERWLPLFLANFRGGPNPVPVKAALALMGLLESRRRPRGRSCRSTGRPRRAMAATLRGARPRSSRRRPDRSPRRAARGRGMTRDARPTTGRAAADAASGRPGTILDDLEAGRVRAAEPDPTRAGGWRVDPR